MNTLISIGQITGAYGTSGEVKVYPLTDFIHRFQDLESVYIHQKDSCDIYHLSNVVIQRKDRVIIGFQECSSKDDALKLKGAYLKIDREDLVDLPPGHYYVFDMIGIEVLDEDGNSFGEITDVLKTGSNDVYVARRSNEQDMLIPATREVVKKIDMGKKKMIIRPLPGME